MNARHRMRTGRMALLGMVAASASACAAIWGFEDLPVEAGPDAADSTFDSAGNGSHDAGPLTDARADANPRDASPRDSGHVAPEAGDAAEGSTPPVCPGGYHDCPTVGCSSDFSRNSCGPSSCLPCEIP